MSVAGKGHNSGPVNSDRLQSFIERVEKLEEERAAIGSDIRDIYAEAKGVGYDVKTMRKVVALRKIDAADRAEQEALLETYMHALGMVDRIEARLASGERPASVAASEGVSRATAYRASQKMRGVENETTHDPETGEIKNAAPHAAQHATAPQSEGAAASAVSQPVPDGGVGTGTPSDDMPPMPDFLRRPA